MKTLLVSMSPVLCAFLGPVSPAVAAIERTDVFYTLDFESVPAGTNPDYWPVHSESPHDGLIARHIAMYAQPKSDWSPLGSGGSATEDYNRTVAVQVLPHLQIIANGRSPTPLTGTKYLKGTIYIRPNDWSGYAVNYCGINGNGCGTSSGKDKPRVNLRTARAIAAAYQAKSSNAAYRQTQYWCFDLGFPADFHEVTSKRLTIMQIASPVGPPENNIELSIVGQSGGSNFWVEREVADGDSNSGKYVEPDFTTPVTSAMVGKMVTHCFKANIDNRSGGKPSFKWMMSVQGASKLTTIAGDVKRYGYSPTAVSSTPKPIDFTWNIPYGSGLNEGTSSLDAPYRGEAVSLILDNVRIGGPASSIAAVHPLGFPEPKCGPPYPCTD